MLPERALQLPARYLEQVKAILREHLPEVEILAYGSRVNGDHYEASDLDLVARFPDGTETSRRYRMLDEAKEALTESNLPIIVQIVDWHGIPQSFRDEILAGYMVVQKGSKNAVSPAPTITPTTQGSICMAQEGAIQAGPFGSQLHTSDYKASGILTDEFLDDVRHMEHRNLAVELLERLLKDGIKARFKTNVVQGQKFSELLEASLIRYRNRAIETAQVIEELIEMAKSFNEAARRGDELGLSSDELAFYDALETNESSVRELGDSVLKEIARQLTNFLRKNLSVDWSVRETVRAKMRAQIKLILKRHKYPPDMEARAVELVLKQAEALSEAWMVE